ncbi:hypothetical protein PPSIR1_14525 [Plesiocystis pacifica SIR-1]|uniref:Ribosomal RNA large subunit methyltransferase K/L n=1 Tax=Plesiocystis pacifica SIR-1 TaxID=391625 RepID=A6GF98_9BACT|nr:bifunctional 23S rRNA (guanine(2069)-N(7))-methyltransferase RlmK/23S rRNA (guanine(2445)-N(2))-methyltransferase RlmL [Plesiocystis pacifica]EDM75439.1 hypothetical protein PPSIR1_14525 [Plesiocystis pacifica SIR-1]
MSMLELYVTAPRGAEDLLAAELEALGLAKVRARKGGVEARGTLEQAYRACLWSRVGSRVLAAVATLDAGDGDLLYASAQAIDWTTHLRRGASLAISSGGAVVGGEGGRARIDNSHFAALRVKDAIVDQLRERWGRRPNVDLDQPDLRLHLHLVGREGKLSVDLSGEGLHRRGYRVAPVAAPLRENLAAAVLLRAGWPSYLENTRAAGRSIGLVDPMCGSATLAIEAAWMAGDVAPGLGRDRWGFTGWAQDEPELWRGLVAEAEARREAGLAALTREKARLLAYDSEPRAVAAGIDCVRAAGLIEHVHVERRSLPAIEAPAPSEAEAALDSWRGLVVCNPPWGERLGERRELESLYAALGARLRDHFAGWEAAILTGDPGLGRHLGLHARRRNALQDGPIECQILRIRLDPATLERARGKDGETRKVGTKARPEVRERSEGGRAFANRLSKNAKKLRKWLRAHPEVSCYRLYDADIPEYAFAVDLYTDDGTGGIHAHVQEYAAPNTVDEKVARSRRGEALAVIREDLDLPRDRVHLKHRQRQKGRAQYERMGESGSTFCVAEGPARLWVNLEDYLDTGLFLDHRPLRLELSGEDSPAAGKRVLNLFCYTAAVSVHAALGGAKHTTSVDLSRTYLDWARRNFALNGLTVHGPEEGEEGRSANDRRGGRRGGTRRAAHQLVRADVLDWLRRQGSLRWDLIICDPPSFSNSKRMDDSLDIQRDHVELIRRCASLLSPGGALLFSTNKRRFRLDDDGLNGLSVEPHAHSVPRDFERRAKIHQAWWIQR